LQIINKFKYYNQKFKNSNNNCEDSQIFAFKIFFISLQIHANNWEINKLIILVIV